MEREQILLKSIVIETLIPEDGTSQLSDLLEDGSAYEDQADVSILGIKRRELLLIDERVRALALLRISHCEEDELKSLLSRTEFRVEVWAFDRASTDDQGSTLVEPSRDSIYSTLVPKIDDPVVLAQQNDPDESEPSLILAWELELELHRPRFRMQDPSIYVHSVAAVSALASDHDGHEDDLVPFKPLEPNILEPMRNMPGFGNKAPYLAASRLERVHPTAPKSYQQFRAETMSHRYRIAPAVITRIRYTRMITPSSSPNVIASLDIEVNPVVELQGTIEKSEVTMVSGKVQNLMQEALPMECRSRDLISLMFRLVPSREPTAAATPTTPGMAPMDVLSVTLGIKVQLSESCRPRIEMVWTTNVDFFQALNPTFGAPSQPIHRHNRPSSLALGNGNGRASRALSTSLQPVLPQTSTSEATISFTAPDAPVKIGQPFTWSMLVINNSAKPIKLAIIPLPRIPRGSSSQSAHFAKRHAPQSSTASFHPSERRHAQENESDVDFAQAVLDENIVYAMQHSNGSPAGTDLLALTAEIRIGPLGPGQCHESQIEMVAFTAGTLKVDAIRIIDLVREAEEGIAAAGVVLDIRDLPDVVVVDSSESI